MILADLSKAINEFLAKGNKEDDTIIKMGNEFYGKFIEACGSQINAEIRGISHFMGILVEQSLYIEKNQCVLINEKKILAESSDNYKLHQ